MSQIKYLVYALLLVLLFAFIAFTSDKLFFTETTRQTSASTTIDFTKAKEDVVVLNSEGKNLFQANCQTCHALDRNLTGPALRGVENRGPWVDRKNVLSWVKNPAGVINKYAYTKQLVIEFSGQIMPSFSTLSEKQIESILDYIKQAPAFSPMPIAKR